MDDVLTIAPALPAARITAMPAAAIEQLQSSTPQHQCFGLIRALWRLVDDADGDAIAGKFRGHSQADGAGTND
jgi:hypothetical protein